MKRFIFYITFLFLHLYGLAQPCDSIQNQNGPDYITTDKWRMAEETIGNPDSESYDEEAFEIMIKKALDSPLLNEADKLRAHYRLEIISKNRIGSIATDFSFKTRKGEIKTLLSDLFNRCGEIDDPAKKENRPILLLFYDPDCSHCIETIKELEHSPLAQMLDVVAIDAEEDYDFWQQTAPGLPQEWLVGFATDPIQDEDMYIFLTSPTLYLLSPDKRILLKDTTLPKISSFLEQR